MLNACISKTALCSSLAFSIIFVAILVALFFYIIRQWNLPLFILLLLSMSFILFFVFYWLYEPKLNVKAISNIVIENKDNDKEILDNITQLLNRKNRNFYKFNQGELTKDIENDSEIENISTNTYRLKWETLNKNNKYLGDYELIITLTTDNYKYAEVKEKVKIRHNLLLRVEQ